MIEARPRGVVSAKHVAWRMNGAIPRPWHLQVAAERSRGTVIVWCTGCAHQGALLRPVQYTHFKLARQHKKDGTPVVHTT